MPHKFVKVSPECGDWEAWYLNGKLIDEGYKINVKDILDALGDVLPNTYKFLEISDEIAEQGFPSELRDIL